MGQWVIGVAFSFASSVLSCLGLIFQKYAHNQNQALPDDKKYPVIAGIVCSPCWWASFIMMGLFPFPFDFFAYSFAAQSLVAPFAGLTLIMNQFFAPLILKEKIYRIDIYASIVVFIGCTITTATGNHDEESYSLDDLLSYYKRPEFVVGSLIMIGLMTFMIVSLMLTDPRKKRATTETRKHAKTLDDGVDSVSSGEHDLHRTTIAEAENVSISIDAEENFVAKTTSEEDGINNLNNSDVDRQTAVVDAKKISLKLSENDSSDNSNKKLTFKQRAKKINFALRPFYYGFVAGGFGALQNVFFKSIGVLMKSSVFDGGRNAFETVYPYLFIISTLVFAVSQLSFLNHGMSRYDAVLVFPLYNACYIFLSVTMGALYYGEFATFETYQWVLFPLGVVVAMFGIIMFVFKPRENGDEQEKPVIEEEKQTVEMEDTHNQNGEEADDLPPTTSVIIT